MANVGTRARITHRVWFTVSVGGNTGPSTCARMTRAEVNAVVARKKWASKHGVHTVWSSVLVGCRLGPSMVLEQGCGAEVNVRPRSLEQKPSRMAHAKKERQKKTIS